jgi:preprotein translocase subunit SecE
MEKITTYFKESYTEMKKVTWPNKKETYKYTLLVIGISIAVAIFLWLLDQGFNFLLKTFII